MQSNFLSLLKIRFWLLIRQKLGWMSFLIGIGLVFLSLVTAKVSFVKPPKIFWDFSFGTIFLVISLLSVYLGSQIYNEEKTRRTLHLLLSAGVSRGSWILGNLLGIWVGLSLMAFFWFLLSGITSLIVFNEYPWLMGFQALLLLILESLIVLSIGMLFSFLVRALLALFSTAALVIFLHSLTSLQRIFTNEQYGAFVDDSGASLVLLAGRFLPPLEWLDLKDFIGYQEYLAWSQFFPLAGVAILWATLITCVSTLKFKNMDL